MGEQFERNGMKQVQSLKHSAADITKESGQAVVESAFVFIVIILLLGGLIEFGWAYFHYIAMQNAAGEGAAYGMMFSSW